MIESLPLTKSSKQQHVVSSHILMYALAAGDLQVAPQDMDRIIDAAGSDSWEAANARRELARAFITVREFDRARELLEATIDSQAPRDEIGLARVQLAGVFESLSDNQRMVAQLEAVVKMDDTQLPRLGYAKSAASELLGKYYLRTGDAERALQRFSEWVPCHDCGTCIQQAQFRKDMYISECLVALGRDDEALRDHLMPRLGDSAIAATDYRIAPLVVKCSEDRGALRDLIHQMNRISDGPNSPAGAVRQLALIRLWKQQGNLTELIAQLRSDGRTTPDRREPERQWQAFAAAKALAELGGIEFHELRERFERLRVIRHNRNPDHFAEVSGRLFWTLYAIGLSRAPDARTYLQQLVDKSRTERFDLGLGISVDFVESLLLLETPNTSTLQNHD
ncbi:MAG: hypothetical protein K2Y37_03900 [Pirellulales bacterium]|nr:hypothetical protein [Pirellulales bacterium]